jgi:hypothetical protein
MPLPWQTWHSGQSASPQHSPFSMHVPSQQTPSVPHVARSAAVVQTWLVHTSQLAQSPSSQQSPVPTQLPPQQMLVSLQVVRSATGVQKLSTQTSQGKLQSKSLQQLPATQKLGQPPPAMQTAPQQTPEQHAPSQTKAPVEQQTPAPPPA